MRFEDRNSWPQHRNPNRGKVGNRRKSQMNRDLDFRDEWDRAEPRASYYNRNRPTQQRYGDRVYGGSEYSSADQYAENIGNTGFSDAGFYDDTSFDTNEQRFGRGEHYGKGPKGWKRSDDSIKDKACEVLADDPQLDASEIEVHVKDGVIHLKGTVDERASKRRAEACVENLSGVQDVINEIRVHREMGNLRSQAVSEARTTKQ